jgi:hypothetical protein
MIIIFGYRRKWRKRSRGYFYCPNCRARRPGSQCSLNNYLTLFLLPVLPLGSSGECYECEACRKQFDVNDKVPFDFGDTPNPELWSCPRCNTPNPAYLFRCRTCGYEG